MRQFQKAPWLDLVVLTAMIYMSLIFDVVLPGTQGCSYSLWLCPGLLDDINITLTVTYDKKFLVYEFLSDDSGVIGHEGCSPMWHQSVSAFHSAWLYPLVITFRSGAQVTYQISEYAYSLWEATARACTLGCCLWKQWQVGLNCRNEDVTMSGPSGKLYLYNWREKLENYTVLSWISAN